MKRKGSLWESKYIARVKKMIFPVFSLMERVTPCHWNSAQSQLEVEKGSQLMGKKPALKTFQTSAPTGTQISSGVWGIKYVHALAFKSKFNKLFHNIINF